MCCIFGICLTIGVFLCSMFVVLHFEELMEVRDVIAERVAMKRVRKMIKNGQKEMIMELLAEYEEETEES